MAKTLTEQYYDGTLPTGFYYFNNGKETYIVMHYHTEPFICADGITVMDKVPSYEEYVALLNLYKNTKKLVEAHKKGLVKLVELKGKVK